MSPRDTSREANDSIEPHKPTQREFILGLLRYVKPFALTDDEIGEDLVAAGYASNGNSHRARRGELVAEGLVRDSGKVQIKPNGRKAVLWEAV